MKEWYVYTLVDPRDRAVFYVGKGCGRRMYAHEHEARNGAQSPKCERIRAILKAGLSVHAKEVKYFADEQAAYDYERELIAKTPGLTNLTCGGGGVSIQAEMTDEALEAQAEEQLKAYVPPSQRPMTDQDRRDLAYLRKYLRLWDRLAQHPRFAGFTFPNCRDGDQLATEYVAAVRTQVAEYEQRLNALWMA